MPEERTKETKEEKQKRKEIEKARKAALQSIDKAMQPNKKANLCYLATHVGKFTDSNIPPTVAWYAKEEKRLDEAYLSYASVETQDVDGIYATAADCGPVKVLCMTGYSAWRVDDNTQMRTHLQKEDDLAKKVFGACQAGYPDARRVLLSVPPCEPPEQTSKQLRQIFFPVPEAQGGYHLLSVLPSSVLMNEMKRRYDAQIRALVEARKNGEPYTVPPTSIAIQFGGAQPQNVSVLASQARHSGFRVFNSAAPELKLSSAEVPYGDFFRHCYHVKRLKDDFLTFFQTFRQRKEKEKRICLRAREAIFDACTEEIYRLRALDGGWSEKESLHLEVSQCHLLDAACVQDLEEKDFGYLQEAARGFVLRMYKKLCKPDPKKKSDVVFDAKVASRIFAEPLIKEWRLCFGNG